MDIKITQDLLDTIMHRIGDEVLSSVACDFDVRTDYSGRGMYGKTCIGITTDASIGFLMMGLGAILSDMENSDDLLDVDGNSFGWYELKVATDNMGLSTIVYFPNLSLSE